MKSFILKEFQSDLEVISYDMKNGFHYRMKPNDLNVKEIVILDVEIVDYLIISNFNKRYKKILEYYFLTLQDDDDSTDGKLMIALDEIARLRSILIRKYHLFLSKKMEEKMFQKLKILENEIRSKVIDFKLMKEQKECLVEEKGRGR